MRPFSLYLHIPFCIHKCPYCDFNTYAVATIPEREYTAALLAELDFRAMLPEWAGRPVQTIFFGGGTPSLFDPSSIAVIIQAIRQRFPVAKDLEVSLEANPGSMIADRILGYKNAGVNRLSLGAQSFNPGTLHTLGRIHTPEQTIAAVSAAKSCGISNINLDLIFGIPGQLLADVRSDLQQVVKLEPAHISTYGLTIEKGTPFYQSYKRGDWALPAEDLLIEMTNETVSFLESCGYQRYEISNFASAGRVARHNLAYWNGDDYLGLGAGAHSLNGHQRWANYALPKKYMLEASAKGRADSWSESLDQKAQIFEFFFLGLRKISGVSLANFETRFGQSIHALYPTLLKVLSQQKLVRIKDDKLTLTDKGLLLADSVIENFAHAEGKTAVAVNRQSPSDASPG